MPLFSPDELAALGVPGVAERWATVQERLHPRLAALAEHIQATGQARFPRQWQLYEVSYKAQRYINRGRGTRLPIEEYHVAFDRPPRGAGILISVSAADQAVLVGLQLWGARKPQLAQVWEEGRAVFMPLVERIATTGQARFAGTRSAAPPAPLWLDHYLAARAAGYLWAGFAYSWHNLPLDLEERLVEDLLALFPLNEALMEAAEAFEPAAGALLNERRTAYTIEPPPVELLAGRIRARGFTISETLVRAYHLAMQTRQLTILPGISGTGKTRLTRLYADAAHDVAPGAAENPYYLLVAVQPDWHNARDLLGYYNALSGLYHPTPFLRFVLRAAADPQQLYFVCLDELNLARPEYYLAPILSALETAERLMDLGIPGSEATSVTGESITSPLRLPLNLRLIGTVNVDESTFALSDKLLDRATLIELTDVDLGAFRAAYNGPVDEQVWQTVVAVHALVVRAGQPFGYRVVEDILRYVERAHGVLSSLQALDLQLKQRVLPKLRGEESPRLRNVLSDLLALLLGTPGRRPARAAQISPEQIAQAPFPESAEKLRRMLERLDLDGYTDFYG